MDEDEEFAGFLANLDQNHAAAMTALRQAKQFIVVTADVGADEVGVAQLTFAVGGSQPFIAQSITELVAQALSTLLGPPPE